MTRWFKRLFIGLATVLIIITVCLLIMPTRWIANAIENAGGEALGATLTIDSLHWNLIHGQRAVNRHRDQWHHQ